jgi:hypothetical protein
MNGEMRDAYNILIGKSEEKRLSEGPAVDAKSVLNGSQTRSV